MRHLYPVRGKRCHPKGACRGLASIASGQGNGLGRRKSRGGNESQQILLTNVANGTTQYKEAIQGAYIYVFLGLLTRDGGGRRSQ